MANIFDNLFTKAKKLATTNSTNSTTTKKAAVASATSGTNKLTSNNTTKVSTGNGTTSNSKASSSGNVLDKVNNFLTKYLTTEGVNSLPDTSTYKKVSQAADKASKGTTISLNSNNIGGIDSYTGTKIAQTVSKAVPSAIKAVEDKVVDTALSPAKNIYKAVDVATNLTNKVANTSYENPLKTAYQKANEVRNNVANWLIDDDRVITEGDKLIDTYNSKKYLDIDSVNSKIQADNTYASKLYNNDGTLIDYTSTLSDLEKKVANPYTREQYIDEYNEVKSIIADQDIIKNSNYLTSLEQNGASDKEIHEFKQQLIREGQDENLLVREPRDIATTVKQWVGNKIAGLDTIEQKMYTELGIDYENNPMADAILDNAEQEQAEVMASAGGAEKFIYNVYNGMSEFVYDMATLSLTSGANYLGNAEAAENLVNGSLLMSDVGVLGSRARELQNEGYDFDTAFDNAFLYASINHLTEAIGGERMAQILTGGELNAKMLETTWKYMTKSASQMFLAEALEEGASAALEPIADVLTLNTGMTINDYYSQVFSKDTAYQMLVGGLGGLAMGIGGSVSTVNDYHNTVDTIKDSITIKSAKDYNAAIAVYNNIDELMVAAEQNGNMDDRVQAGMLKQAFGDKISEYKEANPTADAFKNDSDNFDSSLLENTDEFVANAARPSIAQTLGDLAEIRNSVETQSQADLSILQEQLNEKAAGTNVSAALFSNLSEEAQNNLLNAYNVVKNLGKQDNTTFEVITDKNGNQLDGFYSEALDKYVINPNSTKGVYNALMHEYTHGEESSEFYPVLDNLVKITLGDNYDNVFNILKEAYSEVAYVDENGIAHKEYLSDEDINKEVVATFVGDNLGNQEFVDRLVRYNTSLAYNMYENIKMANKGNNSLEAIKNVFMKAFNDFEKENGEAIKESKGINLSGTTDSNGKELSDKQVEFFANSKIRDNNGKLMPVYHGSNNSFTIFDKSKAKTYGTFGNGFYFSPSKSFSSVYGNIGEYYLNIINPIDSTQTTYNFTEQQKYDFINAIATNEDYGLDNYGYGSTVESVYQSLKGYNDYAFLYDLNTTAIGNMVNAIQLFNEINGTNYDGIKTPDQIVAFEPNQIKETSNQNPTKSLDVRFSKGTLIENLQSDSYKEVKEAFNNSVEEIINNANSYDEAAVELYELSDSISQDSKWKTPITRAFINRANALAQGFTSEGEMRDYQNRVNSFTTIEQVQEERNKLRVDEANAFNNNNHYKDVVTANATKNRWLDNVEKNINKNDMSNFDRTTFEEVPLTNQQILGNNQLDHINYSYAGDGLIQIEAIANDGDSLYIAPMTKERIRDIFGTDIANEIISTVSTDTQKYINNNETNEEIYDDPNFVNEVVKQARKSYGTTNNYNEVGYIDLDGKMIDFSGKRNGAMGNDRTMDHREMSADGVSWYDYVKMGNIRMFTESGGFEIEKMPNEKQQKALLKFLNNNETAKTEGSFIGISRSLGNNHIGRNDVASLVYENGESSYQIMKDVMSYFEDGKVRFSNGTNISRYDATNPQELTLYDAVNSLNKAYGTSFDENVQNSIRELASEYNDGGFFYNDSIEKLADSLWATASNEEQVELGYDKKALRDAIKEHDIKWDSIKGDFSMSYKEFQKEYPFVTIRKNGRSGWDMVQADLNERFGELLGDTITDPKSLFDKVKELLNADETVDTSEEYRDDFYNSVYDSINKAYDSMFVEEEQDFLDEVNQSPRSEDSVDLTIEDIDDILHQRPVNPRTLKSIEETKQTMVDNADKWIKGYDTIAAEYPQFSKELLSNALYETLIYGDINPETRMKLRRTLLSDFDYISPENASEVESQVNKDIQEFVDESLNTFSNEARYKAGEVNNRAVRRSMLINQAYGGKAIEREYQQVKDGVEAQEISEQHKKDLQTKYQPITEMMLANDTAVRETKGRTSDSKVSDWKTIDQNIDTVANGNVELRNYLKDTIRYGVLDQAAAKKSQVLTESQNAINKLKELGINAGSEESKGVQYYMEGHTEQYRDDIDRNNITQDTLRKMFTNPYKAYTLDDLKAQYDYKMENGKYAWENIVEASNIMRNAYDQMYKEVTLTQLAANGDVEGNAEEEIAKAKINLEKEYSYLENILDEIKRNGSTEATQAAYEIQKSKYNRLVTEYNKLIEKHSRGDLTRRQLTPYRENYSHHILKRTVKNTFESIKNAELLTPTELAGISDYTNPNTAFATFSAAQEGGKYTPDAIQSFEAYSKEAANVISYNPAILELRQFANNIRENAKGTQLNKFTEYLNDYCNNLAGKRNNFDRGFQKIAGPKAMAIIKNLNQYAKGAALVGNIRSGLVQFADIPNGLGILESNGGKGFVRDIANGMKDYINAQTNKGTSAIDSSNFLNNRFFDFDDGETGTKATIKDISDKILQTGDKVGAEVIWWGAYEQAQRLGTEVDPVQYADDITRSAIAGRTKEDQALATQSQVINLFLPFQVENNNLYQTIKSQGASGKVGALITYNVAAYLFNAIIKGITNQDDEVLPELITPIASELTSALKGEEETDDAVKNAFWGEVAEFISLTPAGEQLLSLAMDSDTLDDLFGDYNPSRYGMTNIGLAGIGNIVKAMSSENRDALANAIMKFVGSYVTGGKQITRTIEGLQSMGGLPKINNNYDSEDDEFEALKDLFEISPVNYTSSGKIAFVNDQSELKDWIRATLFGKWSTDAAQDYINGGFKSMSDSAKKVFDTLQSTSEGNSTFENYQIAKDYQESKKKKTSDTETTTTKESSMGTDSTSGTTKKTSETEEETPTLREQLIAEGKYDTYKETVHDAYDDYLKEWYQEDHDTDDEPKSFTQFANGYGITSNDLKQDTYGSFYETYDIGEDAQKTFSEALDIENSTNALGKTIANSGATQRRVIYEQLGIYDDILEFIENNGLEYSDFGLTETVVGYDQTKIDKMMAKINGETYEETSSSSSSSSSSKTTSAEKARKKQIAAMKKYMNALTSSSNSNSLMNGVNMTSVSDAKSNVQKILNSLD